MTGIRDIDTLFPPPAQGLPRSNPRRPGVTIHYTAAAPARRLAQWETLFARTDVQVVLHLAEALQRSPARLGFGLTALGELSVFDAAEPTLPLAEITEGLTAAAAETARDAAIRGARR